MERKGPRRNAMTRANYKVRKDLGICVRCPKKPKPGRTMCQDCTEKAVEAVKKSRAKAKALKAERLP